MSVDDRGRTGPAHFGSWRTLAAPREFPARTAAAQIGGLGDSAAAGAASRRAIASLANLASYCGRNPNGNHGAP